MWRKVTGRSCYQAGFRSSAVASVATRMDLVAALRLVESCAALARALAAGPAEGQAAQVEGHCSGVRAVPVVHLQWRCLAPNFRLLRATPLVVLCDALAHPDQLLAVLQQQPWLRPPQHHLPLALEVEGEGHWLLVSGQGLVELVALGQAPQPRRLAWQCASRGLVPLVRSPRGRQRGWAQHQQLSGRFCTCSCTTASASVLPSCALDRRSKDTCSYR